MRFLAVVLALVFAAPCFGAMPYDAVCRIDLPGGGRGSGTLVFARQGKGLIITAGHVVATTGEATAVWGQHQRKALVVKTVPNCDLAILVVDNPPVSAAGYSKIQGRMIVATGYPWWSKNKLCWQVGVVTPRMQDNMLKVTAKPEPGMSGSGCFDYTGNLVAVVSGHDRTYGYHGYKVPELLDQYSDPKTWIPNDSHKVKPSPYGPSARPEKPYRTIPYSPHTAPKLPSIHSILVP